MTETLGQRTKQITETISNRSREISDSLEGHAQIIADALDGRTQLLSENLQARTGEMTDGLDARIREIEDHLIRGIECGGIIDPCHVARQGRDREPGHIRAGPPLVQAEAVLKNGARTRAAAILAETARAAPEGMRGGITGGVLSFGQVGALSFPLVYSALLELTGSYGIGFIMCGVPALLVGVQLLRQRASE